MEEGGVGGGEFTYVILTEVRKGIQGVESVGRSFWVLLGFASERLFPLFLSCDTRMQYSIIWTLVTTIRSVLCICYACSPASSIQKETPLLQSHCGQTALELHLFLGFLPPFRNQLAQLAKLDTRILLPQDLAGFLQARSLSVFAGSSEVPASSPWRRRGRRSLSRG
jgi:hypothetical protein